MLQDFFNPVRYSKVSSDSLVSSIDVFYQWGGKTATLKRKRSCGDQALGLPVPHIFAPFPAWSPLAPGVSRDRATLGGYGQVSEPNWCTWSISEEGFLPASLGREVLVAWVVLGGALKQVLVARLHEGGLKEGARKK